MFFSNKKIVGLDLGTSSIKLSEMTINKNGTATLENFTFISTPSEALSNNEIVDSFLLGEVIKSGLKENKFTRKNVCVGMWGTAAMVKKISMPKVDPKLLRDQIKYEAQQYLPFEISQVTLQYHVLPFATQQDLMDVLIIAGQNEFVTKYVEIVRYAGLRPTIIDVSCLALSNIFEFNYGKLNEPVALFNFGNNSTQFVVVFRGEVIFARDIPVGGFHFTNEISKSMGVTLEEAESLKISGAQTKESPEGTRTSMDVAIDYVTEEVKNSIEFYTSSGGDLQITKAFFTGGASLTVGLIDHLQKELKISFEEMNPLLKIQSNNKKLSSQYLKEISPFMSVSLGLGLRQTGDT